MKHKRNIPFIEQVDANECGLCVLAMIFSYYYVEYNISKLKEQWLTGRDGLSMLSLKKIANSIGFESKSFMLDKARPIESPIIISLPEEYHFVILEKKKNGTYYVLDSAIGKYTLSEEDLFSKGILIALELSPTEKIAHNKQKRRLGEHFNLIKEKVWILSGIVILSILNQLSVLIAPLFLKYAILHIESINLSKEILSSKFMFLTVTLAIGNIIISYLRDYLALQIQLFYQKKVARDFMNKILRLPLSFFQFKLEGDLLHRYSGNTVIKDFLGNKIISLTVSFSTILISILYIAKKSLFISFIYTLFTILTSALSWCVIFRRKELVGNEMIAQSKADSNFSEIVNNIELIKMKSSERYFYKEWQLKFDKYICKSKERTVYNITLQTMLSVIRFLVPIIVLFFSIREVRNANLNMGEAVAFSVISLNLSYPIIGLLETMESIIYAHVYFKRITEVLSLEEEENLDGGVLLNDWGGEIRFDNVSFSYSLEGLEVLSNFNLSISSGESVGIVGSTGSGKSTLISIILGLHHIQEGEIFYGETNQQIINKPSLRKQIGIVSQNMILLNKSIRENIVFGESDVNLSEVECACKKAGILEDIMQMPMGFSTVLSDRGSEISAGQKQRILIARAILKTPKLLIFDEAFSCLDQETTGKIKKNVDSINCTKIFITHNKKILEGCDKIFVMES